MTIKFVKWSSDAPQSLLPPILEFPILVNLLYLVSTLDCGTVYQQIMYIMTLLVNLNSVYFLVHLSYCTCLSPFLLFIL